MLGKSQTTSLFFTGQRLLAGTLSFPLTLINLPSKNKGSQMGILRPGMRKRTAEKTNERQLKKNLYQLRCMGQKKRFIGTGTYPERTGFSLPEWGIEQ